MRLRRSRPDAPPGPGSAGQGRLLLPVLLALLLAVAALGMTYFSFHANRRDALRLTDDTLGLLEERIIAEVSAFLSVPERALQILAEFAGERAILPHERGAAVESATALLRVAPMLALVGFADADGNWLMVRRDPDTGALETKTVAMEGGTRRVFWTRRPAPDAPPVTEDDPDDRFDPRTRPWWRLSQAHAGVSWTDLYVFFTDRQPGVTAVRPLPKGAIPGAVMVDVRLSSLSEFLSRLTVGHSGRALLLDGEGRLVAVGDRVRQVEVEGDTLSPARLHQLGDPVLTRAFDLFRAQGPGRRFVDLDGERYIMLAARLPATGHSWNLLMVVPQDDFIGFVRRNSLMVLAMAMGVVLLAMLLAAYAIGQYRRTQRATALLLAERRRHEAETLLYAELAAAAQLGAVLAVLGRALAARRTGFWRLADGAQALYCEAQFDAAAGSQGGGITLRRSEAPKLFAAIEAGAVLEAADAASDPRTAELARLYLRPVGARGVLTVPVQAPVPVSVQAGRSGPPLGVLMVEDAGAGEARAQPFAASAAQAVARMAGAPAATTAAGAALVAAGRARGQALKARIEAQLAAGVAAATDRDETGLRLFPSLAVLYLALTDDMAVIAARCEDGETLIARIRRTVLSAATAGGITCVRALGERVMLADGFDGDDKAAVRRLCDVAVAIQDRLTDAFTDAGLGLEFRIGLDLGPAVGSRSGDVGGAVGAAVGGGRDWNIYGEAVGAAASLAETAPPGAIQVSETAHEILAAEYLLRPRGRFFVRDTGEIGTWLVAGHA
ncbi:MAG: hypothetical protein IT556_15270 [Acetobacteraceae bacterium]|nr:hypothetical protein [Acetobacteraceae bacterium]